MRLPTISQHSLVRISTGEKLIRFILISSANCRSDFKASVLHTNHRDITKVLLRKESIHQTIRFTLAGAVENTEPSLTGKLRKIHSVCPTLLEKLLPISERDQNQDDMDNESRLSVPSDEQHEKPTALNCIDRTYVRELNWPLRIEDLPSDNAFVVMLEQAYHVDYNELNVTCPRGVTLQWCQKLSFTDRSVIRYFLLSSFPSAYALLSLIRANLQNSYEINRSQI